MNVRKHFAGVHIWPATISVCLAVCFLWVLRPRGPSDPMRAATSDRPAASPVRPRTAGDRLPLVVLDSVSGNFWNSTPSLQLPVAVLYDDGLLIFRRHTPNDFAYVSTVLSPDAFAALVAELGPEELAAFDEKSFYATTSTDAGGVSLHIFRPDGASTRTDVYGWLRRSPSTRPATGDPRFPSSVR